jgi:hypothetical protein
VVSWGNQAQSQPWEAPVKAKQTKQRISKAKRLALSIDDLAASGIALEERTTNRGITYWLIGKEKLVRNLINRANRRIIAKKWDKLGGSIGVLCEPCEWLSLGYNECRKCGALHEG